MNTEGKILVSDSRPISGLFARTSMLTVTITSAIFSLLLIFQTVVSSVSGEKTAILSSLYYFFGESSVSTVNAVFGAIVCGVSFLFFTSFISIYLKAKDGESAASGLNLLTVSSVIYIVVACLTVTFSFASITVQRYESAKLCSQKEIADAVDVYSPIQASYDFVVYILFGAAAILMGIGAVRLASAAKRAVLGEEAPSKRGFALFLAGAISSAALTTISFFACLGSLVIPADALNLTPLTLLNSIINVLVFAAVSALFYGLSFLASGYSDVINTFYAPKPKANSYYAAYATNVNRPHVNPTVNRSVTFTVGAVQNPVQAPVQPQETPAERAEESEGVPR